MTFRSAYFLLFSTLLVISLHHSAGFHVPLGGRASLALKTPSLPQVCLNGASSLRCATSAQPLKDNLYLNRMMTSVEVMISRVFPAGAGWQLASILATNAGVASNSLLFCSLLGLGNFFGVIFGHMLWEGLKKVVKGDVDLAREFQVASLLGGAAFFSGLSWQVAMNVFKAVGVGLLQSFMSVGIVCTMAFFLGMRMMRQNLSPVMTAVDKNSFVNLRSDIGLAIAIGGATAGLVFTDAFVGTSPLLSFLEAKAAVSSLVAVACGGLASSLGFLATTAVQALNKKRCWLDSNFKP